MHRDNSGSDPISSLGFESPNSDHRHITLAEELLDGAVTNVRAGGGR